MALAVEDYLKKPYGRVVVPEGDGTYRAEIIEFPGCFAVGETAAEALASLEDVAASWLEILLEKGKAVPEPIESGGFSGKLVLRLPKSLHKKAAHLAERDGVSLNQFIVSCVAEQVGSKASVATQPLIALFGQLFSAVALRSVDTTGASKHQFASMSNAGPPARRGDSLRGAVSAATNPAPART